MSLYERDYSQEKVSQHYGGSYMRFGLAPITPVVKKLLIANIAVFFIGIILSLRSVPVETDSNIFHIGPLEKWFAVFPDSLAHILQIWRLITYQFIHGGIFHILWNMMGLFFLGPALEQHWDSKKFLIFYLSCGVAGGLFYTFLVTTGLLSAAPMIGASGSILGMLAACAILFPNFIVFIILFPVPIRVAAIIFTGIYIANLLAGGVNAGGDAAHLAGMATGAGYVLSHPWRTSLKLKICSWMWRRKVAQQHSFQVEFDRILQKVHDSGIHSLTSKEKKVLSKATKAEQTRSRL